jgi:hypothetical protein
MKPDATHFFLGANTPNGFYSLYDQLMPKDSDDSILILKGSPGCGKSSLMRYVADTLSEPTEYIHCSGDPDSLDAVRFPHLNAIIVDGTAPHVIEPRYPGVLDMYLNLGACCQTELLQDKKAEIRSLTDQCSAQYQRAYRILSAADQMMDPLPSAALSPAASARMKKRIGIIAAREFKKRSPDTPAGRLSKRLLGGITCQGMICRFDTVDALCSRVYACIDPYSLAHPWLRFLQERALACGYDVISCPAPLAPDRIAHLLIPDLSLAFVTSTEAAPYEGTPVRKLRFDHLPEPDWLKQNRARLRFEKKMARTLTLDAIAAFAEAKQIHDELEALYHPSISFEQVYQTGDQVIQFLRQK